MSNCRNCDTCVHCWRDNSVGDRECLMVEFMTEEEIVTYFEDMGDNCPHYKSEFEQYQDFLQAVVDTDYFGLRGEHKWQM